MQTDVLDPQASPRFIRTNLPNLNNDPVFLVIQTIDLSMVKRKLMDADEGKGWSQEQADAVEQRYKRYLYMTHLNPGHPVVPTRDIDTCWHQHILDTRAYVADCEHVFGSFLHHFPYLGMRGEEDAALLQRSFDQTAILYHRLFGEEYDGSKVDCGTGACAKCGAEHCSS